MGWWFEDVEACAAVHAAEFVGGYDGQDCGDSVIEGDDSERILVGERAGTDEGSPLAKRAECFSAFEE